MESLFVRLRSLLIWAVAFPVFVLACVIVWLGTFVLRGRALEALIKGGSLAILFVCGIRVRVTGRENLAPGRACVAMMNHVNFFDPFVFQAAFPYPLRGAEERGHFRWPLYGGMIRRLGMFPIDRQNTQQAVESLRRAAGWVREHPRFSFGIMPEGTRTLDGRLGPFKRGGFLMALETGLDILPVVQKGAYAINHKGTKVIRPGRVEVSLEPAIPVAGLNRDDIGELVERVRRVFLDRLGESENRGT
jgi:1-acyl-sn-glycerol-3-phosphate acyltransferase